MREENLIRSSRENRRIIFVTTSVLLVCLGILLLSPLLGKLLGSLFLLLSFVGYHMRPPVDEALRGRIKMVASLQEMCRINLAQPTDKDIYTPNEYRQIIKAFGRVREQLVEKDAKRWRLKHLVARVEGWHKAYQKWRLRNVDPNPDQRSRSQMDRRKKLRARTRRKPFFQRKKKEAEEAPTRRPFNPYRADLLKRQQEKHARRRFSKRAKPDPDIEKAQFRYAELQQVVQEAWEYLEPRPLCLDFSVPGERHIELARTSTILLDGTSRLRYILASTGVVMPSVTFAGNSCRLEDTVGLLFREQEVGCFNLLLTNHYPMPRWMVGPGGIRQEGVSTVYASRALSWPLLELNNVNQTLLHLTRLVSQNFPLLLCREALLNDVPDPALPSSKFVELARQYVQNGRTVPRGSFLELSLRVIEGMTENDFILPCETKNLPSFVAATKSPMPFFESMDVVYLTLCLIRPADNPHRQRVEERLPDEFRQRVARFKDRLGEEGDSFQDFLTHLAGKPEWEEEFGPPQFLVATGHAVVERLLQSEPSTKIPHLNPEVASQTCEKLARRDPKWLAVSLLLSYFKERSTGAKVRSLARKQPGRLARLLESFTRREPTRHFAPLEKLKILCLSMGEIGLELESHLRRYLPPLPPVRCAPEDTYRIHLEILARVRYWAVRGYTTWNPDFQDSGTLPHN